MYNIQEIKAKAFEFLLGSEDFNEFQYIRFVTITIINTLVQANQAGVKVSLVKLYDLLDELPCPPDIDPNLIKALDEFKIYINEMISG